ncbi:MAG: chromate transporter [Pseudomonadota bacterium]
METQTNAAPSATIPFKEALKFWTKLGFISFGGPAGQIAIMHQEVVERRKWIGENQFLRALNFCMLLPGPEAQQLATYIGWRLHGTWGDIAAGSLFVIPSIFVMLLLSYLAVAHIDIPAVAAAFYGIQPVVVAVVIEAVLRIGKKALKHRFLYGFAAFVTFGGAYAVLSYITDVAVSSGWLSAQQMLIGLGLAESTPGPLIMVTQYAGFLAAWNLPGGLNPLTAGVLGALLTTYVTFLPCFFFIFAGAPFIEAMAGNQRLQAALTGVTAAVVGVVLNLAVWFGHKVVLPNGGLDIFAVVSAVVSLALLQKFHFPIHYLVPIGATAGVIWKLFI